MPIVQPAPKNPPVASPSNAQNILRRAADNASALSRKRRTAAVSRPQGDKEAMAQERYEMSGERNAQRSAPNKPPVKTAVRKYYGMEADRMRGKNPPAKIKAWSKEKPKSKAQPVKRQSKRSE